MDNGRIEKISTNVKYDSRRSMHHLSDLLPNINDVESDSESVYFTIKSKSELSSNLSNFNKLYDPKQINNCDSDVDQETKTHVVFSSSDSDSSDSDNDDCNISESNWQRSIEFIDNTPIENEEDLVSPALEKKRKFKANENLNRKGTRHPETWEKNINKKAVNHGLAYTSSFTKKNSSCSRSQQILWSWMPLQV